MNEGKSDPENKMVSAYKKYFMKRHHLEDLDLEKEYELIKQKKSCLSRSQREAVTTAMKVFPMIGEAFEKQNKNNTREIGSPATEEDLKQAIEESTSK